MKVRMIAIKARDLIAQQDQNQALKPVLLEQNLYHHLNKVKLRIHLKMKGKGKGKGIRCCECEGFKPIQVECPTYLRRKKSMTNITWSDDEQEEGKLDEQ